MVISYPPEAILELLEADMKEMLEALPESQKTVFLKGLKKIVRNLGKANSTEQVKK